MVSNPPVVFRRPKTLCALAAPVRGGSIDELREFVNVGSEHDWRLFIAVLCSYVRPVGPFPVLLIQGEQGSAKSTTTRIASRLIDHSSIMRAMPRNAHDLMVAATRSWVLTMDNLSGLPKDMSDALCRLSTGGGFATRTLYSDDEETVFSAMRPIVLNGIDDIAERPDLLDRSVVLHLRRIPDEKRITEQEFWARFDTSAPKILGALLDAAAGGLRELPGVELDQLPRMADFAKYGEAVGRALGWGQGAFMDAFRQNQNAANVTALEACPVASAIRVLMSQQVAWSGTATQLLECLVRKFVDETTARGKDWPKTPKVLADRLRRTAPALRKIGLEIETNRSSLSRTITIRGGTPDGVGALASSTSSASQDPSIPPSGNDFGRDATQKCSASHGVIDASSPHQHENSLKSFGAKDLSQVDPTGDDAHDANDAGNTSSWDDPFGPAGEEELEWTR